MPENYTMFGDVNTMTKADFQTAIKYYENRKAKVAGDSKIDEKSKKWFDNFYSKRIEGLNYFYQELSGVIAQEKADDKYVNESAATLESLGRTKTVYQEEGHLLKNKDPFRKLNSDAYYYTQTFKILGAVCLPIVGTIPLVKSFIRSMKKRKVLRREQVELQNFVAKNARSYDQKLYGAEKLTDAEMEQILGRTKTLGEEVDGTPKGEIKRLEEIADNPANYGLSPVQVKNLKKHITELREFAQKNGYTDPEFLSEYQTNLPDEANYKTEQDKASDDITTLDTTVSADPALTVAPTNFKDAYDKYIKIQDYIKQVEDLEKKLPKDMDKSALETLKTELNTRLEELKQKATEEINNNKSDIENEITSAAVDEADRDKPDELNASNNALDNAVTTFATTKLGTTLAEAQIMAGELKIPTDKLGTLLQLYTDSKDRNDKDLSALKTAEENETEIENAKNRINEIINELKTDTNLEIEEKNLKDEDRAKEIKKRIDEGNELLNKIKVLDPSHKVINLSDFCKLRDDFKNDYSDKYNSGMSSLEDAKEVKKYLDNLIGDIKSIESMSIPEEEKLEKYRELKNKTLGRDFQDKLISCGSLTYETGVTFSVKYNKIMDDPTSGLNKKITELEASVNAKKSEEDEKEESAKEKSKIINEINGYKNGIENGIKTYDRNSRITSRIDEANNIIKTNIKSLNRLKLRLSSPPLKDLLITDDKEELEETIDLIIDETMKRVKDKWGKDDSYILNDTEKKNIGIGLL